MMERDDCKTLSVPVAGRRYFGLGRNASYAAARRGDIPVIPIGSRFRVPIVALEKKLAAAGPTSSTTPIPPNNQPAALPVARVKNRRATWRATKPKSSAAAVVDRSRVDRTPRTSSALTAASRSTGAAPQQLPPARSRRPSREKPFWSAAEAAAMDWLADYGCPSSGDGNQAKLEHYMKRWLEERGHEAGDSTVRRYIGAWINKRRAELGS
jgi:hypothetical protein